MSEQKCDGNIMLQAQAPILKTIGIRVFEIIQSNL